MAPSLVHLVGRLASMFGKLTVLLAAAAYCFVGHCLLLANRLPLVALGSGLFAFAIVVVVIVVNSPLAATTCLLRLHYSWQCHFVIIFCFHFIAAFFLLISVIVATTTASLLIKQCCSLSFQK
ncbi:unnamed protein product [Ceratitis capitata]|uniref:(Mediterranean fruit fly) hypothetical protein n=1 Tax=Ceratitis capitata TaxID=7213 RepID=A0A811V8J8_CERCA|nr:unnamed protein product [Ceratitis capitata]